MSTYKKDYGPLAEIARPLIERYHKPILSYDVKIDYVFAFGERDEETGELKSPAIKHHGVTALGLCRKMGLKDRAKGNGDVEITIDGDWFDTATAEQKSAVMDHELQHIEVDDRVDALDRPRIDLRPHDFDAGWFAIIAQRHGAASQERIQAAAVMDASGQYFWPDLFTEEVPDPQPLAA